MRNMEPKGCANINILEISLLDVTLRCLRHRVHRKHQIDVRPVEVGLELVGDRTGAAERVDRNAWEMIWFGLI